MSTSSFDFDLATGSTGAYFRRSAARRLSFLPSHRSVLGASIRSLPKHEATHRWRLIGRCPQSIRPASLAASKQAVRHSYLSVSDASAVTLRPAERADPQ